MSFASFVCKIRQDVGGSKHFFARGEPRRQGGREGHGGILGNPCSVILLGFFHVMLRQHLHKSAVLTIIKICKVFKSFKGQIYIHYRPIIGGTIDSVNFTH